MLAINDLNMKLRIHHIFDIIRDLGKNSLFNKHEYGHSYHIIANKIKNHDYDSIQLVIECDDICLGCNKLNNGECIDLINHRKDYLKKEDFNNYLDKRILDVLNIKKGAIIKLNNLIEITDEYIKNIEYIYEGNDVAHTIERKENVMKGLVILKNIIN